jgi:type VI secretion system protein ImpI
MTLRLSIENMDRLPDGGPVRVEVKGRGLDFGRDAHLDWTLPDPSRTVSSKHCEVRFRDGGYWLHDVSTNGTFVNGSPNRVDAPHLLRDGDRLNIGPYIIAVAVDGQAGSARVPAPATAPLPMAANVWETVEEAAAPDDRAAYQVKKPQPRSPDFLDFAALIDPAESPASPDPQPQQEAWLSATPPREPPATVVEPIAAPTTPSPRRPPPASPREEAPAATPLPQAAVQPPSAPADPTLLRRIALAAGIPEQAIASRDPNDLADEIGLFVRIAAQNLAQMLSSRAESKTLMRSSSRTMIRALENNPLKFAASPEEALGVMFGRPGRQYLDAKATIDSSFADLKAHQVLTYGAMRDALDALFEDLAPERIDHSVEQDHGLGRIVASRKAKLWDIYVDRWRAKTKRADGRLLEAFMALFAEAYDRLQHKGG